MHKETNDRFTIVNSNIDKEYKISELIQSKYGNKKNKIKENNSICCFKD